VTLLGGDAHDASTFASTDRSRAVISCRSRATAPPPRAVTAART